MALAFSLAANLFNKTLAPASFLFCFALVFSLLPYALGAWAGGDAKFYSALASLLPLFGKTRVEDALILFLASALLLGFYALARLSAALALETTGVKQLKNAGVKYLGKGERSVFAHFLGVAFALTVLL